jgi:hypothetical protein
MRCLSKSELEGIDKPRGMDMRQGRALRRVGHYYSHAHFSLGIDVLSYYLRMGMNVLVVQSAEFCHILGQCL